MLAAERRATSYLREEDWPAASGLRRARARRTGLGPQQQASRPPRNSKVAARSCEVFRERFHRQSGSTKRIPKRVRVEPSRTSRTDEAAEPHRLGSSPSRSVEKARKDAHSRFLSTSFLLTKTRFCHEFMPKTTRLATLPQNRIKIAFSGLETSG